MNPLLCIPIVRVRRLIRSGAAIYWRIVLIVTVFGWMGIAWLTRAAALELWERDFVLSTRMQGAPTWWGCSSMSCQTRFHP